MFEIITFFIVPVVAGTVLVVSFVADYYRKKG